MYDVFGVQAATYEEACLIAGCDTPDQLRAEADMLDAMVAAEEMRRHVFSLGSPANCSCKPAPIDFAGPMNAPDWAECEIPF